jgi:hypothetical protein
VRITCIQFWAIDPHEGRNSKYSLSTKVDITDITLGRIVRLFAWNFGSQCVIIMKNYTNSEMTDLVVCYRSADSVG